MNNSTLQKEAVREKYTQIASQTKDQNASSCCGATGCCDDSLYSIMADSYSSIDGYQPDADLGLGCGLPTEFAQIKLGDTVVDLGSGAGNDVFIARKLAGPRGKIVGIDFTDAMIARARANAETLGLNNVEFRKGDIEDIPITSNFADVVVSNCVLNLVPNKHKVFSEIYRILKPGAHFSISDIVLEGELPAKWKEVAELYAGCISGAIQKSDYLSIITEAGFTNIILQKEKPITIPAEILSEYFSSGEIESFEKSNIKITSITVYAERPAKDDRNCCEPGSGCC
ncbi:MAG TPA: arsenite methyltransferase [Chitinophagaceae bacterium]|jgi:SAM-dependent methyltransferase|nr:arsenite methyltransferase [Chitinophagaceae bacterium]